MILYTDGSCSGNPGPGGFAFIEVENDTVVNEEAISSNGVTTNNAMELMAMLSALLHIVNKYDNNCTIYCDSQYVVRGLTEWAPKWVKNEWKTSSGSNVANHVLWIQLLIFYGILKDKGCNLEIIHVKSHKGNKWNDYVDKLAKRATVRAK